MQLQVDKMSLDALLKHIREEKWQRVLREPKEQSVMEKIIQPIEDEEYTQNLSIFTKEKFKKCVQNAQYLIMYVKNLDIHRKNIGEFEANDLINEVGNEFYRNNVEFD